MKKSDENIMKAIDDWMKVNKNNVIFYGAFITFAKDGNIKEDRLVCYGDKEGIKISIEEMLKMINKEKSKFINW